MIHKLKIALLDMNKGHPNQGMRCIREIVAAYEPYLEVQEYDVRVTDELPGTDCDLYLSSGGPGNPLEGNGVWDLRFYDLLDKLWAHNQNLNESKKHFFFICHSFQLACNHFELGEIAPRKSTSFGVLPVHKTRAGKVDPLLQQLPDPFHVVDSRDWQLIQPKLQVFAEHGASILALEKIRTHVEYERAIMAVRFSPEFVGTQFHPEADPIGMRIHFREDAMRKKITTNFSERKYNNIVRHLDDPDKIALTHRSILPGFLENAIAQLRGISFSTT